MIVSNMIQLAPLLLAVGLATSNAQPSEYCKVATKVSTLPFIATPSTGKDEVWFKTEGIQNGADLVLEIQGKKEDVKAEILAALDVDDNANGDKCPNNLEEPGDLSKTSGMSHDDPIPSKGYFWTAQGSASYYIHITSSSGNSDAKFEMELTA
jgi:hypothetical protein